MNQTKYTIIYNSVGSIDASEYILPSHELPNFDTMETSAIIDYIQSKFTSVCEYTSHEMYMSMSEAEEEMFKKHFAETGQDIGVIKEVIQ